MEPGSWCELDELGSQATPVARQAELRPLQMARGLNICLATRWPDKKQNKPSNARYSFASTN